MLKRKLVAIDLVLEPVESYRVSVEDLVQLNLINVHRDYHYDNANGFSESLYCDGALIDLKWLAISKIETEQEDQDGNKLMLDERLNHWKDLVSVDLIFDDDSHANVYVPWGYWDDDLANNADMMTAFLENSGSGQEVFSILISPDFVNKKKSDGLDLDATTDSESSHNHNNK